MGRAQCLATLGRREGDRIKRRPVGCWAARGRVVRSLPKSFEQVDSERDEYLRRSTQPASRGSSSSSPADSIAGQIRAISAASTIGVATVGVDQTFTWVNPALAALLGRRADELVG